MKRYPYRRWQRIDRAGSEYFTYHSPIITAQEILALDYEDIDPRMRRYYPVDYCRITNISRADVLLGITPTQNFFIPAGTSFTIEDQPVTQIRIKNLSTVDNVGEKEVCLIFQRLPLSEDRLIRREV